MDGWVWKKSIRNKSGRWHRKRLVLKDGALKWPSSKLKRYRTFKLTPECVVSTLSGELKPNAFQVELGPSSVVFSVDSSSVLSLWIVSIKRFCTGEFRMSPSKAKSCDLFPVPPNWTVFKSPKGEFYQNKDTGATQWTHPGAPELPRGWEMFTSEKGLVWYHNRTTGTRQWHPPISPGNRLQMLAPPPPPVKIAAPEETSTPAGLPPPPPQSPAKLARSRSEGASTRYFGVCGLYNLGNTCFMNSGLQCLVHVNPLVRYFLRTEAENPGKHAYEKEVNVTNVLGTKGVMASTFASMVYAIWQPAEEGRAIQPRGFIAKLFKLAPQFSGFLQHDCQEFVAYIMDAIHEDLNRCLEKPFVETREMLPGENENDFAEQCWRDGLLRNRSIIVDLFQGQLKSTVVCGTCGYQSIRFEPFFTLSLPVRKESPDVDGDISLAQCIKSFSIKEPLDGDNTWFCQRCEAQRAAGKTLSVCRCPPVLVFHLKRFNADGEKISDLVTYPAKEPLNMAPFLPLGTPDLAKQKYRLCAVVNHYGTMKKGHYTACATAGPDRKWFLFDDEKLNTIPDPDIVVHDSAYMLFYERMDFADGEDGDENPSDGVSPTDVPCVTAVRRQSLAKEM